MTSATTTTRERKSPVRGVRPAFQAFCKVCSWSGCHFYGKGSARDAHTELQWHREKTGCREKLATTETPPL